MGKLTTLSSLCALGPLKHISELKISKFLVISVEKNTKNQKSREILDKAMSR